MPDYQDDPETPEVAGLVVSCALKQLWCRVLQCEAGGLQGGAACRAQAGKSKIDYFQHRVLPLVCKQHVLHSKQTQRSGTYSMFCQLIVRFGLSSNTS